MAGMALHRLHIEVRRAAVALLDSGTNGLNTAPNFEVLTTARLAR